VARAVIDIVIDAVRKDKADFAHGRLVNPQDKTDFGYGYLSGYYTAMDKIENMVKAILEGEKNRE